MGEKHSEVVLFGTWTSPYSKRVELALKIKGIAYEYVEEDLSNKSELLLRYNPVHKKIPVLVHNGKAICESLVILEYIDETWKNDPKLLPQDPYQKARVRFWMKFFAEKISSAFLPILMSKGKEQEKAIEDMNELLKVFHDGVEIDFPGKYPFFNGETLGILDIVVGTNSCNYKAFYELLNREFLSPEYKTPPELMNRINALKEHPLIKNTLPTDDQMVQRMRQKFPHLSQI